MHICNAFESSQRWLYDFSFIFPLDGDDSVHLQAGYPLSCKLRSRPPPSIAQGGTRHRTSTPQTREHGSHTQADVHRVYITRTPIHNPMSISVWKEKEREKLKIPRASYFPGTCSSATASVVLRALDERTLRVTASRCRKGNVGTVAPTLEMEPLTELRSSCAETWGLSNRNISQWAKWRRVSVPRGIITWSLNNRLWSKQWPQVQNFSQTSTITTFLDFHTSLAKSWNRLQDLKLKIIY